MYVVTGGAGSGKSEYAEQLAVSFGGARIYLATMQVYDEEGRQRIARHRAMRAGKQFTTLECQRDLEEMLRSPEIRQLLDAKVVLLECMSNLAANEMFSMNGGIRTAQQTQEKILCGVDVLRTLCRDLIVVTNEVFSDGVSYDPQTIAYIQALGAVNVQLAARADRVTEVVCGIPVELGQGGESFGA